VTAGSGAPAQPVDEVLAAVAGAGIEALRAHPLAGDASTRRFYRIALVGGTSAVAAWYPVGAEIQAEKDAAAQVWARRSGLPVPGLVAAAGRLIVSADLGGEDAEGSLRQGRFEVLAAALECLAAFQRAQWQGAPNPPFDASFFRAELAGFETHFLAGGPPDVPGLGSFLDELATAVAAHPFRLAHRDFHLNNLFLHEGRLVAVDFQDLRGGPDCYDAASFLYERAAPELIADPDGWAERAAEVCRWSGGWPRRLLECRAQRGLKVLGTFARLARERGGGAYAGWLSGVRATTAQALERLEAPNGLLRLLAAPHPSEGL